MSFGVMVKSVRKELGMTQAELADALGVCYATVNRWENGQVSPSILAQKAFFEFCDSNFIELSSEKREG